MSTVTTALVQLNEYGYYEVSQKPTPEELRAYYAQRYYQESLSSYQKDYSAEELEHVEGKLRLRHWVLQQLLPPPANTAPARTFLDVGCGEGWALEYFQRQGWNVSGVDFSGFSLEKFHPNLLPHFHAGDLYEELQRLADEGRSFDVLWLDNVLEHVLDPADLLRRCRALVNPGGALMVDVPNDFSALQQYLLERGHIDREFWVALPDHLSYFSQTGLRNLATATGWQATKVIGDQPIDLNPLPITSATARPGPPPTAPASNKTTCYCARPRCQP
jgi:2-polyprenyl-3-methyl-5-hydroxy-6-metoxy-1,4-benzoquinol methylase